MLEWVLTNLDISGFIVSIIALFISIYSVWYTTKRNRFSLEIDNSYYVSFDESPYQLSFDIVNNSNSGIRIISVEILHNQKRLRTINYEPSNVSKNYNKTDDPFGLNFAKYIRIVTPDEYAEPLDDSRFIEPNNRTTVSYYVAETPDELTVNIHTNKPIHWWARSKSISIYPSKSD